MEANCISLPRHISAVRALDTRGERCNCYNSWHDRWRPGRAGGKRNPFDAMITPDADHRRARALPKTVLRDGRDDIAPTLASGEPGTLIWIDVGT